VDSEIFGRRSLYQFELTLKRLNQCYFIKINTVNILKLPWTFWKTMVNNDIQLDLNQDQAGQVVQQNVPAGGQTTLAFRLEQSKVPDFWGAESKG
jgi:hypothetical protein